MHSAGFSQIKSTRQAAFLTRNRVIFVKYLVLGLRCKCEAKWSFSTDYLLSEVTQALQEIEMNCEDVLCIKKEPVTFFSQDMN